MTSIEVIVFWYQMHVSMVFTHFW
uniref:Uncharacterized protein n=1 Tax=Arundo donax TaxID=35708 RepID=A0A0A9AKB2_ARUDO